MKYLRFENNTSQKFHYFLPICINKFFIYKIINKETFKKNWKNRNKKIIILKTGLFFPNTELINKPKDFEDYFFDFIKINKNESENNLCLKIGSNFQLFNENHEFFIKLTYNNKIMIQIKCDENDEKFGNYILQTYYFLLNNF